MIRWIRLAVLLFVEHRRTKTVEKKVPKEEVFPTGSIEECVIDGTEHLLDRILKKKSAIVKMFRTRVYFYKTE